MPLLRVVRAAALVAASCFVLVACDDPAHQPVVNVTNRLPDLQFSLTAAGGATVTQQDVKGKIALVFFGYANCPDICPTTMARLSMVTEQLGDDADNVRILFISVDPHRDTPEILDKYVRAFDNTYAMGLAGTPDQIERLARRYRVSYQILKPKDPDNPNYDVSHSKGVYVFDHNGEVNMLVTDIEAVGSVDALTSALRNMIAERA